MRGLAIVGGDRTDALVCLVCRYMNAIAFDGHSGETLAFFMVHAAGTIFYSYLKREYPAIPKAVPAPIATLFTNIFAFGTAGLFVAPFIRASFFEDFKAFGLFGPVNGFIVSRMREPVRKGGTVLTRRFTVAVRRRTRTPRSSLYEVNDLPRERRRSPPKCQAIKNKPRSYLFMKSTFVSVAVNPGPSSQRFAVGFAQRDGRTQPTQAYTYFPMRSSGNRR